MEVYCLFYMNEIIEICTTRDIALEYIQRQPKDMQPYYSIEVWSVLDS